MSEKLESLGWVLCSIGMLTGLWALGFAYELHLPGGLDGMLSLAGFTPVALGAWCFWKADQVEKSSGE
jgi:hypothetical protein